MVNFVYARVWEMSKATGWAARVVERVRGGLGGALPRRERLQQALNKSSKIRNIFICPSTSSFQAQKTRREGACYSNFRPEGCPGAGEVKVVG
jgi:hypothetical protein